MSIYWTFPSNFKVDLYRAGWKSDRTFARMVADIGGGQFAGASYEDAEFIIKANTINKVRKRDIQDFLIPTKDASLSIGPDTELDGIRLARGDSLLGGISLFDSWKKAPITSDAWYIVPTTVEVPKGLMVVKANFPSATGAFHYTLGPAERMTLRHFIVLLTPLANNSKIVML